jgi:hypothetical protein
MSNAKPDHITWPATQLPDESIESTQLQGEINKNLAGLVYAL